LLVAARAAADPCVDGGPFAIVDGRAFLPTPPRLSLFGDPCPRFRAVLRVSSADNQDPQILDKNGAAIIDIFDALHGANPATLTVPMVAAAIARAHVDEDPVAATFALKYLYAADPEQVIATDGKGLTMEQAVSAARFLGYLAAQRYDNSKWRTLDRPIIPPKQVYAAAAAELDGTRATLTAGDCADIANAQGALLQKLGARDVVVTSVALLGGLHSTVVARAPGRQTYYQLDYDLTSRTSGREGADLLRIPSVTPEFDIGPAIYLNRPNGRSIGFVPTDAGKIYVEAAGMDIHRIEPLARANSTLLGAQMALSAGTSLRVFGARDAPGDLFAGAALSQTWASRTLFPGSVGLVTASRRTVEGVDVVDLFLQAQQQAHTPSLSLGHSIAARADATLIAIGSYAIPFHELADDNAGADGALLLDAGAQVACDGAFLARAEAQLLPGLTNMGGATPTVFLNHVLATVEGRHLFGRRLMLTAAAAFLFDEFGTRLDAGLAAERGPAALRLEFRGRLSSDGATYKEGSLRRARLAAAYSVTQAVQLSLLGEIGEGDRLANWTVTGGIGARF
jgi:hypothetical protein